MVIKRYSLGCRRRAEAPDPVAPRHREGRGQVPEEGHQALRGPGQAGRRQRSRHRPLQLRPRPGRGTLI